MKFVIFLIVILGLIIVGCVIWELKLHARKRKEIARMNQNEVPFRLTPEGMREAYISGTRNRGRK